MRSHASRGFDRGGPFGGAKILARNHLGHNIATYRRILTLYYRYRLQRRRRRGDDESRDTDRTGRVRADRFEGGQFLFSKHEDALGAWGDVRVVPLFGVSEWGLGFFGY